MQSGPVESVVGADITHSDDLTLARPRHCGDHLSLCHNTAQTQSQKLSPRSAALTHSHTFKQYPQTHIRVIEEGIILYVQCRQHSTLHYTLNFSMAMGLQTSLCNDHIASYTRKQNHIKTT